MRKNVQDKEDRKPRKDEELSYENGLHEKFALFLIAVGLLVEILRLIFKASVPLHTILVFFISIASFLVLRFWPRQRPLVSFFWLLGLVSVEIFRSLGQPIPFFPFLAWIPVAVGISCFLSGPLLGAVFTLIVMFEAWQAISWIGSHATNAMPFAAPNSILIVQITLVVGELLGGCLIFWFARVQEREEAELEKRRLIRVQLERQEDQRKILGHLAHELNNPLAILHAGLIRYRKEEKQGSLSPDAKAALDRLMADASSRIEDLASSLKREAAALNKGAGK